MTFMQSEEIRNRFLKFFENRGHAIIPSASLVPKDDPSVLFTTAGMHPLVPYLLGQPHPKGKRIADVQKCVRTQDIDEVGDNTHDTFFEMLGNWSLGDYFKNETITWSYQFLTSKEEGLGLDPARLYVTVFEGDENAPKDFDSLEIWKSLGIPEHRIYFMPAKSNWWSPGDNGPCGPDTEMFYDVTENGLGDMTKEEYMAADDKQQVVEIWNDVFMEFEKKDGKVVGKLSQKNVDTGAGLERLAMVMQKTNNVFNTDLFRPIMDAINQSTDSSDERVKRIVADHIRTASFMIADGVIPTNSDRGYVLRRLLRRAIRYADILKLPKNLLSLKLISVIVDKYKDVYPELDQKIISAAVEAEESKFRETLEKGMKEFEKGTDAFTLFTTYGFPVELTVELAKEKGEIIKIDDFYGKMKEHQEKSRTSSAGMFKGGLANHNEKTVRLHTAHHLLLAALQHVLGESIKQRGSNITEERLRIDFAFERKMTDEEKKKVEDLVNEKIGEGLNVIRREMPKEEAMQLGAEMEFGAKYGDTVSVYFIEEKNGTPFSKEFCGGPHVSNTSELGHFKILKEEAVSAGVRRIKAVLEQF